MDAGVVVLILTLLLGLQPITTDLYLPTLPGLQRDLGASIGATQLTLSALILCFGFSQLACGPLSDRWGRRPVLLAGLALYTLASVASTTAQAIGALVAWRALQGVALAAAVTGARSIVRDLYAPHEGARVMSRAFGGLGLIAMVSPLVGGVLAQTWGWQAALSSTAVFGAATLAYVALRLDETLVRADPRACAPAQLLRNWRRVCSNPTFRAWTALLCATYGGLFVMLAGSSFLYINMLGTSRGQYGLILSTSSIAYIGGTWLCRRLLLRHGLRGAVRRGAAFSLAGGLSMGGLSLAGVRSVWAIMVPMAVYAIGHGIHQPCGQAGAVGPFPDKAGAAASLSGFAMMATAFSLGQWLGHTLDRSVYPVTLGVAGLSVVLAVVAWTVVQRDGEPAAPARAADRDADPDAVCAP
jgi:DHA1 family bicyclomycin/chloramphenicol resistance-like MFS transporter